MVPILLGIKQTVNVTININYVMLISYIQLFILSF